MKELIGLTSSGFNANPRSRLYFKQQALIFDRIAVLGFGGLINLHESRHPHSSESYAAELRWLGDRGILYEPDIPAPSAIVENPSLLEIAKEHLKRDPSSVNIITQACKDAIHLQTVMAEFDILSGGSNTLGSTSPTAREWPNRHFRAHKNHLSSELRFGLQWLSFVDKQKAVLAHSLPQYEFHDVPNLRKSEIWQIVLGEIPILEKDTPWERIVDFREDVDSRNRLIALNHWVNTVAASGKSADDIRDELTYLRTRYEEALALHKLEFRRGVLEVVVEPVLGLAENLLKLQLSKLPGTILKWRKAAIDLQKTEAQAPGREISYLLKVENSFGEAK